MSGAAPRGIRIAVGLTFSVAVLGAIVGLLSFAAPDARASEGRLVFVPLILVVTVGVVVLVAPRLMPDDPAHVPRDRSEPDLVFNALAFLTLAGLATTVIGIIATRGDSTTSAAGCQWALTGNHGAIWCVSRQRWLAVEYGSNELAIGIVTIASAVACGFLNEKMRRLRRRG